MLKLNAAAGRVRASPTRDVARVSSVPRESRTIRLEEKWSLSKVNTTSVPKAPSTYVRISFPRATFSTLGREKNYMQIELRNMFRRARARARAYLRCLLVGWKLTASRKKKRKRKKKKKKKKRKRKKRAVIRKLEKGSLREVSVSSSSFFFFLSFSIFTRLAFLCALDNDTPRPVMFHPMFRCAGRNACFAA